MTSPTTKVLRGQVPHGHAYIRTILAGENGQTISEHWNIHGAGHAWAGGMSAGSYTDPRGPDATREILRLLLLEHHNEASPSSQLAQVVRDVTRFQIDSASLTVKFRKRFVRYYSEAVAREHLVDGTFLALIVHNPLSFQTGRWVYQRRPWYPRAYRRHCRSDRGDKARTVGG